MIRERTKYELKMRVTEKERERERTGDGKDWELRLKTLGAVTI